MTDCYKVTAIYDSHLNTTIQAIRKANYNLIVFHIFIYSALSISRGIFVRRTQKRRSIARPLGRGVECIFLVHSLNNVLDFFLSFCVQYRVLFDRDLTRV